MKKYAPTYLHRKKDLTKSEYFQILGYPHRLMAFEDMPVFIIHHIITC